MTLKFIDGISTEMKFLVSILIAVELLYTWNKYKVSFLFQIIYE